MKYIIIISYIVVFVIELFTSPDFLGVAFDSGGVTTGPMTVPFILALGVGVASITSKGGSAEDSFGLVALASLGPIMAVLLMGVFHKRIFSRLFEGFGEVVIDVVIALLPIAIVFVLFQVFILKLPKKHIIKIIKGMIITFIGLTLFLQGVNAGFMPIGELMGMKIGAIINWLLLIPIGFIP